MLNFDRNLMNLIGRGEKLPNEDLWYIREIEIETRHKYLQQNFHQTVIISIDSWAAIFFIQLVPKYMYQKWKWYPNILLWNNCFLGKWGRGSEILKCSYIMHNAVVELQGWKRTCQLSLSLSPSVVCHFRHTENKSDLCKAAMSKSRTDFAPQVNILRLDANDVLFCANRWWYNLIIWTCLLLLLPLLYSHQGLFASDMQVFKAVENLQCSYCRESKGSTSLHSVKTWCQWCTFLYEWVVVQSDNLDMPSSSAPFAVFSSRAICVWYAGLQSRRKFAMFLL